MNRVNGFDRHYAEAAFVLSTSDAEPGAASPWSAATTAYIEQSVNRGLLLFGIGYIACVLTISALGMLLFLLIG